MAPTDDRPVSKPHPSRGQGVGAAASPRAVSPRPSVEVYLGLGSNLGDRASALRRAVGRLTEQGILQQTAVSPVYETDPVTVDPQPPYLNAVIRGRTHLAPGELLAACLAIEAELGRVRPVAALKAPRLIDIDLLLYGPHVVGTHTLQVPHPALLERPFVRIPLADVASPRLKHPVTGADLTDAAPASGVRLFGPLLVPNEAEE